MNYLLIPDWVFVVLCHSAPAIAALGGAALVVALGGTRHGWEPRCARCGHDIRAVAPLAPACHECGADLSPRAAVRTGARGIRPAPAALAALLLALAVLASWKLDPSKAVTLRASVVRWTPLESLVDAAFQGGRDGELACGVLRESLEGHRTMESTSVPSGALLEALLKSADRCEERGRTPLSAVLESKAGWILNDLDPAEVATLALAAAQDILANNTQPTPRTVLMQRVARDFRGTRNLREEITLQLARTSEGRQLLQPRPIPDGTLAEGALGRFVIRSPLEQVLAVDERRSREPLTFVFGSATLENRDGTKTRVLANAETRFDSDEIFLLMDAPPGTYHLRLTGASVPTALLPEPVHHGAMVMLPVISLEDALKLPNATSIDSVVEIEIQERSVAHPRFTTDLELIGRIAQRLSGIRVSTDGDRLFIADLVATDEATPDMKLALPVIDAVASVRQGAVRQMIGSLAFDAVDEASRLQKIPQSIDIARPFELILEPRLLRDDGWHDTVTRFNPEIESREAERSQGLAICIVHFENALKAPTVEVVAASTEKTVLLKRDDEATRQAVASWAKRIVERVDPMEPQPASTTAGDARRRPLVEITSARLHRSAADGTKIPEADWPWPTDLALCGWLELRTKDRMVAPIAKALGPIWPGRITRFDNSMIDVAPEEELFVRYTPDERVCRTDRGGVFQYLAVPFELRYAGKAAPKLVWLNSIDASTPTR